MRKRVHNADEIMAELVVEQRWNDGYGAGSGPSPDNPCRRVSRPNLKFKLARYAPKARTLWGLCPGGALTSPTGGQLVQASQDKCLPPIGMLDVIQLQIGQPAQQRADCDFSLDAGELGPEAVMDAATE